MTKHAVFALLGFLGLCLPLAAQQTDTRAALTLYPKDLFRTVDSSVLIHDFPLLTLLDGRRLPLSTELGRMGTTPIDLFPVAYLRPALAQKTKASQTTSGKESPEAEVAVSQLDRIYSGGEVGMFYGHSSGKFGGDDFATYIQGEVGNEHFHISVGAAYEESNGRLPRFGR